MPNTSKPTVVIVCQTPAHFGPSERISRELGSTCFVRVFDACPISLKLEELRPEPNIPSPSFLHVGQRILKTLPLLGLRRFVRTAFGRWAVQKAATSLLLLSSLLTPAVPKSVGGGIGQKLRSKLTHLPAIGLLIVEQERLLAFRLFLKHHNARLVIFNEDNICYRSADWIRVAQEFAPAVVLQYTIGVEAEWETYFSARKLSAMEQFEQFVVEECWPEYTKQVGGRTIHMDWITAASTVRYEQQPLSIWSGYGGFADLYLVDDAGEFERACKVLPRSRVKFIEPLEVTQARTFSQLNSGSKIDVLVMLPPNQFADRLTESKSIQYVNLLEEFAVHLRVLRNRGISSAVCLHPRAKEEYGGQFLQLFGDVEIEHDLVAGLARCRVMVICGSAIGRFGQWLDIHVIDWDVFLYQNSDFWTASFQGGYEKASSLTEVVTLLERFLGRSSKSAKTTLSSNTFRSSVLPILFG